MAVSFEDTTWRASQLYCAKEATPDFSTQMQPMCLLAGLDCFACGRSAPSIAAKQLPEGGMAYAIAAKQLPEGGVAYAIAAEQLPEGGVAYVIAAERLW